MKLRFLLVEKYPIRVTYTDFSKNKYSDTFLYQITLKNVLEKHRKRGLVYFRYLDRIFCFVVIVYYC